MVYCSVEWRWSLIGIVSSKALLLATYYGVDLAYMRCNYFSYFGLLFFIFSRCRVRWYFVRKTSLLKDAMSHLRQGMLCGSLIPLLFFFSRAFLCYEASC